MNFHFHITASTGPEYIAGLTPGDVVTVNLGYGRPYTGTVEASGLAKFGGLVAEDGPVLVTTVRSREWYGARLLQTIADESGNGHTCSMPTTYVVEYLDVAVA